MVLQDTWLFNSTIRDNIAYGNPNAPIEDIIEAAKLAGIHEYIEKLPKKYDTEMLKEAQDKNIKLATWTVDNPKIYKELYDLGIRNFTTNRLTK